MNGDWLILTVAFMVATVICGKMPSLRWEGGSVEHVCEKAALLHMEYFEALGRQRKARRVAVGRNSGPDGKSAC